MCLRRFLGTSAAALGLLTGVALADDVAGSIVFDVTDADVMVSDTGTVTTYAGAGDTDDARNYYVAEFEPDADTCIMMHRELPLEYDGRNLRAFSYAFSRSNETGTTAKFRVRLHCVRAGDNFNTLNVGALVGKGDFVSPGQYDVVAIDHGNIPENNCEGNSGPLIAILRVCRRGGLSTDDHSGYVDLVQTTVYWK